MGSGTFTPASSRIPGGPPGSPGPGAGGLGEAERQQILTEWNDTWAMEPAPGDIGELFAVQARLHPDAVAVTQAKETLTYRELARKAGRLARRLRSLEIGPEALVGVCLDRSPRMLEALLGTLGAGGAYLPLDPSYPAARLAYILEDSRAALLLTERRFATEAWMGATPRICLDEESRTEVGPVSGRPVASAENLAYVLYTSGSTGRPKGVQVPRGALVNFLRSMQLQPGFGEGETLVSVTTLSFDIAALELFLPLLCGGRVVIASREEAVDGARLAELLDRSGAAAMQATPTTWRLLLYAGWRPRRWLRVLCGGEAFPRDLAARLLPLAESVWNLYGPTETTVWSCLCRVESAERPLPIGRPIRNTRVVVLDQQGDPAPIGAPGELCIAGRGLARGYRGRPELTADRFVPDPFGEPGERLYRTGDLARSRADGTLEFLGRIDQQVKLRGFRIELEEIEAELARHAAVDAAVVAVRGAGGNERLVAWYLSPGRPGPTVRELREHLARRLPEAMVPSAFMRLESLPLTPNNKVDRRALPEPGPERPELPAPYVVPGGELETRLARLWSEVLGVEAVGAQDRFFDLGGDSIRGALVVNRLQKELGEPLYVMPLFDAPTPAAYADYLRRHYGRAVTRCFPGEAAAVREVSAAASETEIGPAEVAEMRGFLARRYASTAATIPASKLRPALFILSPPRAGSTLLRVMLAGHPRLFSPPELHLLSWETLAERAAALSGRESFAAEGLVRAVMELEEVGTAAAERVHEMKAQGSGTRDVYRWLQERTGGRLLVDKTPTYGLDPGALCRAERIFDGAFYLHLVRHPRASVRSYVEARMDQVYGLPFAPQRQAELIWLISHENISEFLAGVPRERWLRVRFEDLVRDPETAMRNVCGLLGLDFDPGMLHPYEGNRMTDGLHGASRMMGDPRFHEHRGIDAAMAVRWLDEPGTTLSEPVWRLAGALGYERPDPRPFDLRPLPRQGELPLSFAQERLWFLDRLLPGNAAYNVPLDLRLAGTLDPAALAAALCEITRRHEALRSSFPAVEGRPVLAVAAPAPLPLPWVDLTALPAEALAAEVRRLAGEAGRRPFDLERGPLMRAALLRLGERMHRLLVTLHHAICDGWSRVLLLEELAALYSAFAACRPSPLPELPVQYPGFAQWQRQWLVGERIEGELRYWRERLCDAPVLTLPSDRPRPAVCSFHGLRRTLAFPGQALGAMKVRARAEGVTLFMLLASAFFILLQRYSGQRDLLTGAAAASRHRVELEKLIGCFVNTLVLRAQLEDAWSFRDLLAQVRRITLEAYAHQDVPFEKLVEELQPERDLSRNPLFQAALTLHGAPLPRLDLPGLGVEPLDVDTGTAKLDLTLQLVEERNRLAGFLELSADLFDADTAARIGGHLGALLAAAATRPETTVANLPLLTDGEHHQVLLEWNDTRDAAAEPPVHIQLEAHAGAASDSLAVAGGGLELTYGELVRRANQLARLLRAHGVGLEVPVAVCEERSPELVVAVLGILKAGGAYLPLDPTSPAERLAWLLEDSGARVVVTRAKFLPSLQVPGAEIICLDRDRDQLAATDASDPAVEIDGANLAYVIYTSGSTGRPKGVAVSHAMLANLVAWHRRVYGLAASDRASFVASPAFDASVWEIWPYLASGASLHIPDAGIVTSPAALAAWLAAERITVGFLPTPLAEAVLVEPWPAGARLRTLLTGGDRLQRGPGAGLPFVLINHYGPTENTVVATCCPVPPATVSPPIGRPIDSVRVHLFGAGFQPLPAGVPGELCLGGGGLARGYLGRPDLTAGRFVPDPFSPQPGARLYRTGDLVRFRRDGGLEFLGRFDHQVKIRGFRIELGEIEAVLGQCPGVVQAVAIVAGEKPEDRRLAAYAAVDANAPLTAEDLRTFAAARLPAYMVPSAVVFLDALPLTAHGKIDRGALPFPKAGNSTEAAAPRNAVEEVVAGIWGEILGIDVIGVHHNFFALGGHSLKATQVISRLRGILRLELPARLLFEEPTVAGMSGRLLADPRTKARVEKAAQLWLRLADFSQERLQEREALR
jgi:amino acid adenylation domain-containing protein